MSSIEQDVYEMLVTYIVENQDKFYRLAFSYAHNQEDALDIVQNAVCKALENYQNLNNQRAIRTWMYRIVVNESLQLLKAREREVLSGEDQPEASYQEPGFEAPEEDLMAQLDRLEWTEQEVIRLRYFEELSLKEIAELHARVQQEIAKADARRAAEMGQKRSVQRQATVIGVGQKWSTPVTDSVRSQTASIEVEQLGRAGDANENLHVGNAGIESLDDHVQRKATVEEKILDISRKRSGWKRWTAAAAGLAVLFTLGLNTNQAFAQGMEQVPVLGVLAKVLTIRSYEVQQDDLAISVEIPSVETIAADTDSVTGQVNEDIYTFCEAYAAEAQQRAEEYKEAFLATGGTQEEWAAHDIRIQVSYDILTQTEDYLSLVVSGTESWTSAYSELRYYTLDMHTGKWIALEDVLGADYAALATEQVRQQAEALAAETGVAYDLEQWQGVTADTSFYMNADGNPVVVLEKYEIAPGAEGRLEFEITQ